MRPSVLRWEKGGEIMQLPLRDAREVFEREYLLAQVTRFGAISRAPPHSSGWSARRWHRNESLGLHGGAIDDAASFKSSEGMRRWRVTRTSMTRCRSSHGNVHIEDRGYQLADGVYEVVGVHDGRLIDEGRTSTARPLVG